MTGGREPATAAVIVIGNEILSGRTVDANLPWLARELNALGIRLREGRFVPDDADMIVEAVDACRRRWTYVFTTGGIGPTHDDITAAAIARAFGRRLIRHPEAERRLRAHYPPERINEARLKMAEVPEGADLVDNPVSVAPGFRIDNVYVFAGIPRVAQAMFESIRHQLAGGPPVMSRGLLVFAPEGEVAALLSGVQARFRDVEMGSYPFFRFDRPGTNIVLRSPDAARIAVALDALRAALAEAGIEFRDEDAAPGREQEQPG
jgi:molybdenum cofactor synthesis domain-containing protein